MSDVVIVPTTGNALLGRAVRSVLAQTVPTACYVVCDGPQYADAVRAQLHGLPVQLCVLPRNTGASVHNSGHRIYAAFPHLVDEDHVMFLDEDNWLDADHVQRCSAFLANNQLQWCHALRKICAADGTLICLDDCESLGAWPAYTGDTHLVDTGCFYVPRRHLIQLCQVWHSDYYADRRLTQALMQHFPRHGCVGHYTANYTLSARPGAATRAFFETGNAQMAARYGGRLPWRAADAVVADASAGAGVGAGAGAGAAAEAAAAVGAAAASVMAPR